MQCLTEPPALRRGWGSPGEKCRVGVGWARGQGRGLNAEGRAAAA